MLLGSQSGGRGKLLLGGDARNVVLPARALLACAAVARLVVKLPAQALRGKG